VLVDLTAFQRLTGNNYKHRLNVLHTHTTVWLLKNYSQRILTYYTRILSLVVIS